MKTKIFTLAIAILGFTSASFAQDGPKSTATNATAEASATMLTPLKLVKTQDLNFGKIASSNEQGTAVLTTESVISRTGGVAILDGITPTAAQFTVTGEEGQTYSMSAPASIELTSGSTNLTLALVYDKEKTGNTLASGTSVISVGGTLTVPANTVAGEYKNESGLKITVNYE